MSYSETSHVTIWTWPVKIGTVIAIFLVAYALAYYGHIRVREEAPGLTGEHRDSAIKGATRICTTTVRATRTTRSSPPRLWPDSAIATPTAWLTGFHLATFGS
jgi:hypothetical protein